MFGMVLKTSVNEFDFKVPILMVIMAAGFPSTGLSRFFVRVYYSDGTFNTWKVSKYGVISGQYFPVLSPNTGKYGPENNSVSGHFLRSTYLTIAVPIPEEEKKIT